jgi:hypothetical protein
MFIIMLTPTAKDSHPHIWLEGGKFFSKKSAEFQAKQTRKMKELYSKVEVIPNTCGMFEQALAKASPRVQALFA